MNILVSKNKKDSQVFQSIKDCLLFVEASNFEGTILIEPGIYKEKINVTLKNVVLKGLGDSVVITFDDFAGKLDENNQIIGTTNSTTFTLGPQSENVHFENIIFKNSFHNDTHAHSQAVAYKSTGDRISFSNCSFVGRQDTLYLDDGRHYLKDCYIEGTVDFIFGGAVALFQNCEIMSLDRSITPKGYITANRTNHNITTNKRPFGFVFLSCHLSSNIVASEIEENKVFLGRPWRQDSSVIFASCYMEQHISKQGWTNMKENSFTEACYFEYNNSGEGSHINKTRKQLPKNLQNKLNWNEIFNNSSFLRKWDYNV